MRCWRGYVEGVMREGVFVGWMGGGGITSKSIVQVSAFPFLSSRVLDTFCSHTASPLFEWDEAHLEVLLPLHNSVRTCSHPRVPCQHISLLHLHLQLARMANEGTMMEG